MKESYIHNLLYKLINLPKYLKEKTLFLFLILNIVGIDFKKFFK